MISHGADSFSIVFTDRAGENQIAAYRFTLSNLKVPYKSITEIQPLEEKDLQLLKIKIGCLDQLQERVQEFELSFSEAFPPNFVLVPQQSSYNLFIIIGATEKKLIPFGNDYLFKANKEGKIIDWQRFHKTFIPTQTAGPNEEEIDFIIHSHLKMTPEITATDICTFRLYGVDLYGMKEFKVSSGALGKIFEYNAASNRISESSF